MMVIEEIVALIKAVETHSDLNTVVLEDKSCVHNGEFGRHVCWKERSSVRAKVFNQEKKKVCKNT